MEIRAEMLSAANQQLVVAAAEGIRNTKLAAALAASVLACVLAYRGRARLKLWAEQLNSFLVPREQATTHFWWSLFLVSFGTLYIEIMLIRWVGTEVRIFAYFQNLALIACFLGFGLGCYWSERWRSLPFGLVAMAVLIALVEAPIHPWRTFLKELSSLLGISPDSALWSFYGDPLLHEVAIPLLFAASVVTLVVFLILLVAVMIPLGQWVGFYLDRARNPIGAYSMNLLGSVAGIWIFAGLSFLRLPPEYWFALGFFLFLVIRPPSRRFVVIGLVALGGSLIFLHYGGTRSSFLPQWHGRLTGVETYWSPYQKLSLVSFPDRQYAIGVNNTGYMNITNLSPEFLAQNPEIARNLDRSPYDIPFRFANRCDRVLIVGAGAGNDAAGALRNGASQVDTVEIDPVIYSLGERLHPEHPYKSPKVRRIIQDARAFLRQSWQQYDVILFGLLDSHTQFSDYSNMRIDNYVYTEEAFREARRLLKPGGILVVKFEVRTPWTWLGQRFYAMLGRVFDRPPVVFFSPQLDTMMVSATVFITSNDASLWTRAAQPQLTAVVAKNPPSFPLDVSGAPPPARDDWPYVYHRSRSIPRTYLTVSLILLVMAVLLVRRVLEPKQVSTWHFFLLGAGFLLLETQMISRLALYFGTTWLVNCVALSAILVMLVVANLYVDRRRPTRLGPYYSLLVACLLANYFFPWQELRYGSRTVGILLSVAYSFSVFFAGVVFTETFRRCERKSSAFGVNIVGAVAGGLTQNISFVIGMKALLLLATLFYALAGLCWLVGKRQPVPGVAAPELLKRA